MGANTDLSTSAQTPYTTASESTVDGIRIAQEHAVDREDTSAPGALSTR